jgi:hypothetical protein
VSHARYELCLYIPGDGILHSHRRENLRPYILFTSFVPTLGSNQPHIQWVSLKLSPEVKRQERETGRLLQTTAEIKKNVHINSPIRLHGIVFN